MAILPSKKTTAKKVEEPKKKAVHSSKPVAAEQALAHKVLRRALITEKGTLLSAQNKVLFEVAPQANRTQIAQAVFEAYGIHPLKVRTINYLGKVRRTNFGIGQRSDWKKAIVTLPEGQSIAVHDAV